MIVQNVRINVILFVLRLKVLGSIFFLLERRPLSSTLVTPIYCGSLNLLVTVEPDFEVLSFPY